MFRAVVYSVVGDTDAYRNQAMHGWTSVGRWVARLLGCTSHGLLEILAQLRHFRPALCKPFTGCPVSSMRSTVVSALLLGSVFSLIACGSEDDSGAAPSFSLDSVGAPCDAFTPCGPAGSVCLADFPGGFCAIPCLSRVDCPNGSECIEFQATAVCVAGCSSSVECREGYVCENTEGLDGYIAAVCVVDDGAAPVTDPDAGGTDGSGAEDDATQGDSGTSGPDVPDVPDAGSAP